MREQEEAMNDAYSLQQAALDHFYQEKKADVSSEAYTDGEFNPRSRMGMYVGIREMMNILLEARSWDVGKGRGANPTLPSSKTI